MADPRDKRVPCLGPLELVADRTAGCNHSLLAWDLFEILREGDVGDRAIDDTAEILKRVKQASSN